VVAPIMSLQFDAGSFFTNAGFIAVALGGMSSLPGAVAGGLFLGVAEQLAAGYVSSLFAGGLGVGLLFGTVLFRPRGVFVLGGRRQDVREELRVTRSVVPPAPEQRDADRIAAPAAAHRAALLGQRRLHELAGHHADPVYCRARARRPDGILRTGQSWSGRIHG